MSPPTVLTRIEQAIGASKVLTDAGALAPYAHDESEAPAVVPMAVVRAASREDVVAVLREAERARVSVTPRGAGTGRTGGAIASPGGIVLAMDRQNQVIEVDRDNLVAVVEPGVVTGELQALVEKEGLFYPPDPNSLGSCAIGGNVAENAGGPRALKYGVTREYVLGLEVVRMGGERLRVGRRTVKGVTGYDLTALLVGSEGTLGVFTEVTLRLVPAPPAVMALMALFADAPAAGAAVAQMVRARLVPRVLELLDAESLAALRDCGAAIPERAGAMLLVEVDGDAEQIGRAAEQVAEACGRGGAIEVLSARTEAERQQLWAARRDLSLALRARHAFKLAEDVVVPRSRLPALIERAREIARAEGLGACSYGHAGDGNLHVNFLWQHAEQRPAVERAVRALFAATMELGGTLSGEHGIGSTKAPYLAMEQSSEVIQLQRELKAVFDPHGLLNPGKIFAARGHGSC